MKNVSGLLLAAAGLLVFGAACASSGAGGRKVEITQKDDGCAPTSVAVTPGEKLNLLLKNESSSDAYEAEGIDGTKLEEVVVHEGKTLSVGYTVPSGAGTHKIKCYVPAGASTIIEFVAAGAAGAAASPAVAATSASTPSGAAGAAGTTVAVTLVEYSVTTDKPSVSAGKIRFIATNVSKTQVHELAVLKRKPDGSFDNLGEAEAIDPGTGKSLDLDLAPGAYTLACMIAVGEAGSTVDHYQQGMHTDFTVK
jgi:plastocyanin